MRKVFFCANSLNQIAQNEHTYSLCYVKIKISKELLIMALTRSNTFTKEPVQETSTPKLSLKIGDINDILCSAIEGGISYWCSEAEVVGKYRGIYAHEQISQEGTLLLHDAEVDKKYVLTMEKFIRGLKLFLENRPDLVNEHGRIDVGNIDAVCADCIV